MAVWASCAADYRLGWELDTGRVEQGDASEYGLARETSRLRFALRACAMG